MNFFHLKKLLLSGLIFCNCYEFTSHQSARLLNTREVSVITEYSPVFYTHARHFSPTSQNFGFQVSYGISNTINVSTHYSRIQLTDYPVGYNFLSFSPIFGILKDRLAISFPLDIYFGENIELSDAGHIQPTLYFTQTINSYLEVTVSPKYILFVPSCIQMLALNGTIHLHLPHDISLIPEFGYARKPFSSDRFIYCGIGLEFSPEFIKKK